MPPPDLACVRGRFGVRRRSRLCRQQHGHRRCTPHVRRTYVARSRGYSAALVFFRPIRFHSDPNRHRFRARNAPVPLLPADLA
jgi:hypothetical protein